MVCARIYPCAERIVRHDVNTYLKTIPGVGNYSALIISSEIGDIARFHRPEKLSAYAGIVPSVRNSAEIGPDPARIGPIESECFLAQEVVGRA